MSKPATHSKKSVSSKKIETAPHDLGDSMVPPKSYVDSYILRTVAPNMTDFDVYDYAMANQINVLIEGPTGLGKTSSVMAYAADNEVPFYSVPSNVGIDPSQLFGRYIPDEDGGFQWVDGPVTSVIRTGGILLINEVNFMPERIATVLFGLLDKRRQIVLMDHKSEVITAPDDLLIVADMNPGYEGTRPLNKAFRNRFGIQMTWDYDPNIESGMVISPALQEMATRFRAEHRNGTYETPVSTNMMVEFERTTLGLGFDFAKSNFVAHFNASERSAVELVVDSYADRMKEEIVSKDSDLPQEHPLWEKRQRAADGWIDPQWGVKGVDWVFDETEAPSESSDDEDDVEYTGAEIERD